MAGIENLDAKTAEIVEELGRRFAGAGFELNLVGGTVRDLLDGRQPGDVDLCTNATPDQFERLIADIGTVYAAGRQFGTLAVSYGDGPDERVEITTYRTEGYDTDSRKPEVAFTSDLVEDLSRRDFTVNAMAVDVIEGSLVDPFGGRQALVRGQLITPGDPVEIMVDDPLRAVRAVRFSAVRGWEPVADLVDAIRQTRQRLEIVSRERITAELVKILTSSERNALVRAVEIARLCQIAETMFDVFLPEEDAEVRVRIGVVEALFALAEAAGVDPASADEAARRLKLPTTVARGVSRRLSVYRELAETVEMSAARALARRNASDLDVVRDALEMADEAGTAVAGYKAVTAALAESDIFAPLPVDGNDLLAQGLVGPQIGEMLRRLEALRCQDPSLSRERALALVGEMAGSTS